MRNQLIALATGLALLAAPAMAAKTTAKAMLDRGKVAKKPATPAATMKKPVEAVAAPTPPAPPAAPTPTTSAKTKAAYTTADTAIGDLLDDPVSKAILGKHIPALLTDSRIEQARGFTLKAIQPMAQGAITDQNLSDIDADLAKAAPGK